ncbi:MULTISPECIES: autotransporter domain-containing protein [unclassified Variovorax]|uniref:autotransporter domain-containing protein n=1 Tax=unclassified Variovorax TaxID=663243 RepID=UPI002574D684|nr:MULTISPECIES: autotransporter domain-containing protein [unclassified Variovorax]MDM0090571.1 autotransporter domain-containing protein [Variovorax sp. J22G40]MDM0147764.1 autotransporter domain-containing protein [Variovorax sp. J2P1-31]
MALAALSAGAVMAAPGEGGAGYTDGVTVGGSGGVGGAPVTAGELGNGAQGGVGGAGGAAGGAGGEVGVRVAADGAVSGLDNGGKGADGAQGATNAQPQGGAGGGGGGGAGIYTTREAASTVAVGAFGGNGGNGGNVSSAPGNGSGYGGGGGGGQGGAGLVAASGGAIAVGSGVSVLGGAGGQGGSAVTGSKAGGGQGGAGGAGVALGSGMTLVNNGSIAGGSGGFGGNNGNGSMNTAGVGGVGIVGADISIVNNGTISGGFNATDKTQASAIVFTGGTNRLEIHAGSALNGRVIANGQNDTLAFGGAQDGQFELGAFMNGSIQGFESYEKTGSGTWTMLGNVWGAPTGQIREGTLRVGDGSRASYIEGAYGVDGETVGDGAGNGVGAIGGNGLTALKVSGGKLAVEANGEVFGGNGGQGGNSFADIGNGPTAVKGATGGNGGHGVELTGGTVLNAGSIRGGAGGGGGAAELVDNLSAPPFARPIAVPFTLIGGTGGNGGHGVLSASTEALVNDSGRIEGGQGGYGGYASGDGYPVDVLVEGGQGGAGGHGVLMTAQGAQSVNNANVRGGNGGQGGSNNIEAPLNAQSTAVANGGAAGAGVAFLASGTLDNTGSIAGGQGGNTGSTHASIYNGGNAPSGDASATAKGATNAASGGAGVYFGGAASITNSGSINGGVGAGSGGFDRIATRDSGGGSTANIYLSNNAAAYSGTLTATATGSVGGQGGEGILMRQGGQLTNTGKGWIQGGSGGMGASAQATVYIDNYAPTFAPNASISAVTATGVTSATGGDGGRGGDAVVTTGGSIVNEGTIQGGSGGRGGSAFAYFNVNNYQEPSVYEPGEQIAGKGGNGGVALMAASTRVFNAGGAVIQGGNGGQGGGGFIGFARGEPVADAKAGAGNLAISGSDLTIINAGTIAGGFSGDGLTQADAIAFTGGVNSLTLHATSEIAGRVSAFSAADTFALGGKADGSFDVAAIGPDAQYRGFGVFRKVDESSWTLGGSTAAVTPWTIDQGTLSIASDASLGAQSGALTIGAGTLRTTADITTARQLVLAGPASTVSTDAGTTLALDGAVSGPGRLVKDGAGTLRLGSANSYAGGTRIAAGTLVGGTSSFGSGPIANDGALVIDQATNSTLANDLSGTGSLTKTGAATVFYTGNGSAYTGSWKVAQGTLSVTGSLGGTLTVDPGTTLKGNGTIGNTFLSNGATVAPGNSIGTLTVNGDLSFAPGAFYQVETNAQGQSDRIDVTGTATLGGASVIVISADGNWGTTTRYTILTSGNRVGTFGGVSSNFAFLDPALSYEANNVLLTLTRNTIPFPAVGQTFNQRSSGAALEALGGGALYDAVVQLDAPTARSAFDQLSGELHASVRSSLMEDSRFIREAGIDRLRQSQGAATDLKTVEGLDGGAWARIYGSWGETKGDGNAAKVDRDTSGVLVGADRRVGNWRVGVMGGAGRSDVDVDARRSSAKIDNYHLGVYGGTEWGALALRTGASYSHHAIDTHRSVGFTGVAGRTDASYDARTLQVFGELGWRIDAGPFALEPFANLAHARLKTDGFTEQGGITALRGRGESTDTTFTTLGLRASTRVGAEATGATLRGLLGWRHAFGDVAQRATLAFAGGAGFTVAGVPIAKDAAVIEAGLDFALRRDLTLGVSYAGQAGDGVKDHGVKASLLWKF